MTEGIFLYFLPGKSLKSITREELAQNPFLAGPFFELIHSPKMFRERLIGGDVIGNGPGGLSGCVISIQPQADTGQVPGYFRDRQTWHQFGGQWIGYETDLRPGPQSLRRASLMSGYEVELGDGKVWIAPTIRAFDEREALWQCRLPMAWTVDQEMNHVAEVLERHRELWEATTKIFATVLGGAPSKLADCFEWATRCIGANYRLGIVEASILRLFTDETMISVMRAAVDYPLVDAVTEGIVEENPTLPPAGTNMSDGHQA